MAEADKPKEPRRPPSVREMTAGRRAEADRSLGGNSGEDQEEGEVQRPTPVREMMAPEVGPAAADWEPSRRTFEHEGREWVVTLAGQTVTGLPSDPGAPLMHLHFAPADDPERPEKELLCVGRGLEKLFDEELRQYLERARPHGRDPS